jgi:hypothetical protein
MHQEPSDGIITTVSRRGACPRPWSSARPPCSSPSAAGGVPLPRVDQHRLLHLLPPCPDPCAPPLDPALGWGRSSAGHRIWPQGSSGRCARPCRRGTAAGYAAGDGAPRPLTITEASSDRRSSPTLGHDRAARPVWLVSVRRHRPRP